MSIFEHDERVTRPFFKGSHGERYYFDNLRRAIHERHPEVLGEHITIQLEALGLLEAAEQGGTPCQLPFTFAERV